MDIPLSRQLFQTLATHSQAATLLPIFCFNLNSFYRLGFLNHLIEALHISLTQDNDANSALDSNDLKWLLCSLAAQEPFQIWQHLIGRFSASGDKFFEAMVVQLAGQFPLPGFRTTQWNSIPSSLHSDCQSANKIICVGSDTSLLRFFCYEHFAH